MKKILIACLSLCTLALLPSLANAQDIKSVTLEGGPIATKHFQAGEDNYRERHGLGILKVETNKIGTWALYFLNPNSVDNTSLGLGYVLDPYDIPVGNSRIELTAALGLVTGYQSYPVPLLAGQAKWVFFENQDWDAGVAIAANPYYSEDKVTKDNDFGIVVTSPFLSIKRKF